MMDYTYDEYELASEKIKNTNKEYLQVFYEDLLKFGLKEATVNRHYSNVEFYINVYLLREDAITMDHGTNESYLNDFFEYFFIRKCMWSTPGTIKSTAASLKKF